MGDEGERAFERFRPLNRSPTRSFFVLAIVDRERERGRGRAKFLRGFCDRVPVPWRTLVRKMINRLNVS